MRGRYKALLSAAVVISLSAAGAGLVDCASPTQIVVEVYSDACPGQNGAGQINTTEITVGHPNDVDTKPKAATRDRCEQKPNGVGTLTIFPSGANDDEVAIKVVAGVDPFGPVQCHPPDYAGCIVNRRDLHFIPNVSQHVRVDLSLACLNRVCAPGQTCDNGACKAQTDILADGGTKDDASISEAGLADAPAIVDAGSADACAQCNGTCDPGKSCTVDCKTKVCSPGDDCSPTLPCTINCDGMGRCNDISCTTNSTCTVNCGMAAASCNKVTCNAATCVVDCSGNNSCAGDGGIFLDASLAASLNCDGDKACTTASCSSPDCTLTCNPNGGGMNACPMPRPCSGGCSDWNNP